MCLCRAHLRQLAQERSSDPEDILDSESLQTLSLMPPSDAVSFKEILTMSSSDVHATWLVCGQACLDITTRYAMRANGTPVVSNFFAPADLHARFDYQGAAGSKPLSRGR
ncbi:hypothetical protein BC834DRAFT_368126 [Gloeopeniophorella convolvens]|nr:hypothetical protein BC834DRAFT_368126 [Gloeopeniophorella convolvens]